MAIGDLKQLPPFSYQLPSPSNHLHTPERDNLNGFFARLLRSGRPMPMLTKQYRMHPDIARRYLSKSFYKGKVLTDFQSAR